MFAYKNEVLKTIDEINSMRTFFYLTDLSDTFTENFGIDQIVRYGLIIDLVKCGALLEEADGEAAANGIVVKPSSKESNEYRRILNEIKKQMI